jgi:ribose/xylose/arabinose/galactoside ABC-type transport system permease subunit
MSESRQHGLAGGIKKPDVKDLINNHGIVIGFILIVITLSVLTPNFLKINNIINVLRQVSCIGIATIGVGILIIMAQIDLTLGSTFAFAGVLAGMAVSVSEGMGGLPPVMGYLIGIGVSLGISLVCGFIVAKARIPAFIVTLGTMSIVRGMALVVTHGRPVGDFPEGFNYFGSASLGPIPWPVVIYIVVIAGTWFLMERLPLGRHIYAVGSNEPAARYAGIDVDMVKIRAYLLEGLLVGLGGTLLTARIQAGSPLAGQGYEMDAIAGAIIGGVSFYGGIGKVGDMVLGALLIGVINNGIDLLGVEGFYKQVVKGLIIVIAVLIDRKRSGRAV